MASSLLSKIKTLAVTVLLGVLLAERVSAQSNNYLVWNDDKGQTPCDLAVSLCGPSSPTSLNASSPSAPDPTICTCRSVFFNIWSACKLVDTQILPNWNDWQESCTNNSVSPQIGFPEDLSGRADIPEWAQISIPEDTGVFDVTEAVRVADGNTHKWTTVQMVLPLVIGTVILVLIASVFFCLCRRVRAAKKTSTTSPPAPPSGQQGSIWSRIRRSLSFSRAGRVQQMDPRENWKIDDWIMGTEGGRVQLNPKTTSPAFVEFPYEFNGHQTSASPTKCISSPESPNDSTVAQLRTLAQRVHLPWKRGPRKVKAGPRGSRFRLDDIETSTQSSTSRRATLQSSRFGTSIWSSRTDPSDVICGGPSGDGEAGPGPSARKWSKWKKAGEGQADPERMTLLSAEEKSVLVIGNPPSSDRTHIGTKTNIDMRVIAATPSSSTRFMDSQSSPLPPSPRPPTIRNQRPTLPPLQTSSPATPSRSQMQLQALPPLVVDGLRPSQPPVHDSVTPQPSLESRHRLSHGQSKIPPEGQSSSPWISTDYNNTSISRTSSPHIFTKTVPPSSAPPAYQQSVHQQPSLASLAADSMRNGSGMLIDDQQQRQLQGIQTLQPLRRVWSSDSISAPSSSSLNLAQGAAQPHYLAHQHTRTQSNNATLDRPSLTSLSSSYGGSQSRLDVPSAHHHPYQGSLRTHHKSMSSETIIPSRNDPVMLFPGAVRGAGYTVSPQASNSGFASPMQNGSGAIGAFPSVSAGDVTVGGN